MAHGVLFLFHGFLRCLPLFLLLLLKTDTCISSFRLLQVRSLIRLYQTWQQVLQGLLIFRFSCFPRVCLFNLGYFVVSFIADKHHVNGFFYN
ncbi:hypothetical protein NC651_037231 [Populus alba x Populus x berolinensis]|nr:hypothetical protein NC651_037231 [Populus alba x Populus x berolinensis]